MATGVELATAWVRIVPSVDGLTGAIAQELAPIGKEAAKSGEGAAKGFTKNWKKYLGAAAITAGVVAAFKGLYEVGKVFDDVSDTIRVGTGATGKDLEDLVSIAKSVGKSIPAEWESVGATVSDINTRMGLTGETLETVSAQFLEASRVLGEDVDIMKAGAAFNAFKIQGDGVAKAMDHLFRVSQATGIGMNELAAQVQSNAPAVQALGFDFETTTAMVGAFDKAGLNTSQVMMAMSRGLVTMAKDGEEPQAAFKRITADMGDLIKAGNKAAAIDLASGVFGTRAAVQFVGAVEDGVLGIDDLIGSLGASEDTILGVAKETNDFAEKWKIVGNRAQVALEPLGSAVFAGLSDALDYLMPLMEDFGAWLSENPALIQGIAIGLGVLAVAFLAVAAAMWIASLTPIALIIGGIVIAVGILTAAIIWLVNEWDAVVAWVTSIWQGFVDWIMGVIDGLVEFWNSTWEAIGTFFTDIWDGFIAWITEIWEGFTTWIMEMVTGYLSWWIGIWTSVGDFFVNIWNGFIDGAKNIWNGFVGWIESVLGAFASFWGGIWDGIGSAFEDVWNGIKSFFHNIWNGIVSFFEGGVNGLIGILNAMIDAYNFVAQAWGGEIDHVADVKWSSHPSNPGDIPGLFAGGTILQSGTVLVGERGPELLHLPAGAVVDPDISGAGGKTDVHIYAAPGRTAPQELADFRTRRVAW